MPYKIKACAGKPYRPSNGTEGLMFQESFCSRCRHDDGETGFGQEGACEILARSMLHDLGDSEYPKEWTHDAEGRPTCTAFERELLGKEGR